MRYLDLYVIVGRNRQGVQAVRLHLSDRLQQSNLPIVAFDGQGTLPTKDIPVIYRLSIQ